MFISLQVEIVLAREDYCGEWYEFQHTDENICIQSYVLYAGSYVLKYFWYLPYRYYYYFMEWESFWWS